VHSQDSSLKLVSFSNLIFFIASEPILGCYDNFEGFGIHGTFEMVALIEWVFLEFWTYTLVDSKLGF